MISLIGGVQSRQVYRNRTGWWLSGSFGGKARGFRATVNGFLLGMMKIF